MDSSNFNNGDAAPAADQPSDSSARPRSRRPEVPTELPPGASAGQIAAPSESSPTTPRSADPEGRSSAEPPKRPGRFVVWLLMLVCLIVACPPLLVEIHRADIVDRTEARVLATSIYTWHRHHASAAVGMCRLVAYLNNVPQIQQFPANTWSHLLAFSLGQTIAQMDGKEVKTEHLVVWARLLSVLFALLTIAAVYWCGHSIGGVRPAALAALVCAANPVFIHHARLATEDIQHAALSTMAFGAALWAIRPLRAAPSVERQFIGWVFCGLALGGAILTGGPWTILYFGVPVLFILILCPGRVSHLLGLLAAMLIGILLVVPWLVYVDDHDPQAYRHWIDIIHLNNLPGLSQLASQNAERAKIFLPPLLPWTIWIVGAMVQPFSSSTAGARLRMLLGWVWFATSLVLVMLNPNQVRLANQLVILPATAILIGQLFRQYGDLAAEGRHARFWRLLRWPHLLLIFAASTAIPLMMFLQSGPLNRWFEFAPVEWYFALGLGVALVAIWLLSLSWSVKHFPGRAVVCWVLGTQVLVTVSIFPMANAPSIDTVRRDALVLVNLPSDQPIYWLIGDEPSTERDGYAFLLLYANRAKIQSVTSVELDELVQKPDPFVLVMGPEMAQADEPAHNRLVKSTELAELKLNLWRFNPEPSPPALESPKEEPSDPAV